MKVIEIKNNTLCEGTRPIPAIGEEEVLIQVEASGINRADIFQVQGKYPPPEGVSDIPGLEVAGVIAAVGANITGWQKGDRVAALLAGGGYAEYAVASVGLLLPVREGLSSVQAAALPEACFTVWMNLFVQGGLKAGDTVLIHGGASGIGTLAIQCARTYGATVFVTARSSEKCQACIELGATRAINTHEEDFLTVIKEETHNKGVNLILDMIGGDYIQRNMGCLSFGGKMISLAFMQTATATVNFMPLLIKNLTMMGTTLRSQPLNRKIQLAEEIRTSLWPLIEKGQIHPVIDRVFPLKEATAAHHYMQSNQHIGKIILEL